MAAAEREHEFAAQVRNWEEQLWRLRDEVVLFRDFVAGLSFVYRVPSVPPGADIAYVISGGVVLFSFPFPATQKSVDEVKARVRAVLSRPGSPSDDLDADLREERFLVARWFRWKPEERQRGISFERFLRDSGPQESEVFSPQVKSKGRAWPASSPQEDRMRLPEHPSRLSTAGIIDPWIAVHQPVFCQLNRAVLALIGPIGWSGIVT